MAAIEPFTDAAPDVAQEPAASRPTATRTTLAFNLWTMVVLAVAVVAVVVGWNAHGGTVDPTDGANQMGRTTAVVNSAVLVFREGLETILVLAAITASLRGAEAVHRRPVAIGAGVACLASIVTWFAIVAIISIFDDGGLDLQAATGIPAIAILLLTMNWFFHRAYWTGWIQSHHKRRKGLMARADAGADGLRAAVLGLALLGFTSVYREGFEIDVFLQSLRERFGASVVLEGAVLGLLFTGAVGVITFSLHRKLPYKRLLVITGVMLLAVLFVMVGEEVNEMQLAGWIGTTEISWLHLPGWMGQWFSLFANVETIVAQVGAVAIVLGCYAAAQYVRIWRPRRRARDGAARAAA